MDEYNNGEDINNNENNNNNVDCSSSNDDVDDVTSSSTIEQWILKHETDPIPSRKKHSTSSLGDAPTSYKRDVLSTGCKNQSESYENYVTSRGENVLIPRLALCKLSKLPLQNGNDIQETSSCLRARANSSPEQIEAVSSSTVWEAAGANNLGLPPLNTIRQSASSSTLSSQKREPRIQYRRAKSSPVCDSSCGTPAQETPGRRGYSITTLDSSLSDLPLSSEFPCSGVPHIRNTMTSKMRFELRHGSHDQDPDELTMSYLTPTQRKDQQIRDLRLHVKELTRMLQEKEREDDDEKHSAGKVLATLEGEIEQLVREVAQLREENKRLKRAQSDSVSALNDMVEKMKRLEETMLEREKDHETMFLKMYHKGMRMAQIQRQEEIEDLVNKGIPSPKFHVQELIQKLALTETELGKWQALRLAETYKNAQTPETEAETTLRFLQDACFHYLTDPRMADDHLRAMIHIFDFTDSQKTKIAAAMTEKRKKKK